MLFNLNSLITTHSMKIKGIIHIGACQLEEKTAYNNIGIKDDDIQWIEANPYLVQLMKITYPNSKLYCYAIGNEDNDKVVLNISNNLQSSSILELNMHKMFHPDIYYTNKVETKMRKIETLIENNEIEFDKKYNFLNLDIQGFELEALKGFGKYLDNFDYIYTEVNDDYLYSDCALYTDIDEYLKQYGFSREDIIWTGARWGDALYIKK